MPLGCNAYDSNIYWFLISPQILTTDSFNAEDALTFDTKYTTIVEIDSDLPNGDFTYDLPSAPVETRYIVLQRRDKDNLMSIQEVDLLGFLQ